jgi:hypothetical protein
MAVAGARFQLDPPEHDGTVGGDPAAGRVCDRAVRQVPWVPAWETSPIGPFDRWPTGSGFDHLYGFIAGPARRHLAELTGPRVI